jgi:hypothetical protein
MDALHAVNGIGNNARPESSATALLDELQSVHIYNPQEMQFAQQLASIFYREGMIAYGSRLKGEEMAKEALMVALILGGENGMAVAAMGPPGGGKSLITEYGHTIVGGIAPGTVARVPHRADLTPVELNGKSTSMIKETTTPDGTPTGLVVSEEIKALIVPIIKPNTRVIQADEITRSSSLALNSMLKIMQDGRVETIVDGVIQEITELDLIVTAMNNYGTIATNKLDPAVIGRHGLGVFMNERKRGDLTEGAKFRWTNPERMFHSGPFQETSIAVDALRLIRRNVPFVQLQDREQQLGMALEAKMLDFLEDNGQNYADTRPADQIIRIAQALTLLHNKEKVDEVELRKAFQFWTIARLGMTGKISSNQQAETIVSKNFAVDLDQFKQEKAKLKADAKRERLQSVAA